MERSKIAAMFNDDDDDTSSQVVPSRMKPLDQAKLSHFTGNTVRKSKREKDEEAAEAKRREEEAQAAKAYADFLDDFDAPAASSKGGGGFVRASASGDGPRSYNPLVGPRAMQKEDPRSALTESDPSSKPKPKGKRAMDAFLEEIKQEQADREERHKRKSTHATSATAMAAYESLRGSRDTGDPDTTNIFVANLPQNITEQSLGQFFARHGSVGSVKIMWPRGDSGAGGPGVDITSGRRAKSQGLSGFVQYMKRKGAEACIRELDGFEWGGSVLRVGWSKAVPLPPRAMYEGPRSRSRSKEREKYHSNQRTPSASQSRDRGEHHDRSRHRSYSRSRSRSRSPGRHHRYSPQYASSSRRHRSRSRGRRTPDYDLDYDTRKFIRTVAQDVKNHGKEYEDNLREREHGNPKYAFLWKTNSSGYDLFKSLRSDALRPMMRFDEDGAQSIYSTDSAEQSEDEQMVRKEILGKLAKKRFEVLLRRQTGRRGDMARAMVFCIDHAHAAPQVVEILISSLLVDGTAVPRKVARLHLICDILHNSAISVHKAWKFRQEFQARLPLVFDHLGTIYHSFPGRMTAETFKKQILAVVAVWEDWIVFPTEFTQELRRRLDGEDPEAEISATKDAENVITAADAAPVQYTTKFKASSFQPAAAIQDAPSAVNPVPAKDVGGVDGEPLASIDDETMDDIDGEVMYDVDGEAMDDFDNEAMDGEPLVALLDGEPINSDSDGRGSGKPESNESEADMVVDSDSE